MASVVMEIEPKRLWKHFDALTRIPRSPSNEAKCFTIVSIAPLVAA